MNYMRGKSDRNKPVNNTLFWVDKLVCGENQVPAELYGRFGGDSSEANALVEGRVAAMLGATMEVVGKGMATYGLSSLATPLIFASGALLSVVGGMVRLHNSNKNGELWNLLLLNKINQLGQHRHAVEAALIQAGISTMEVESLQNLPSNVYNSELSVAHLNKITSVLNPISSAVGIAAYGDYVTAGAVASFGLVSFPLGEYFYRDSNLIRAAEFRAGKSSGVMSYMKNVYDRHIAMTDKINLLSFTPELLFAFKYLFTKGGNALPTLYGIQQGLQGLSGVLGTQRTRESTKRTTEVAMHLIHAIGNKPFIATPERWKEHVDESGSELININYSDGLAVRHFAAHLPSGNTTALKPISLDLPVNSAVILRAGSGTGKSVTLMGILHLLEHSGSIYLIKNNKTIDVHTLQGPEKIAEEIVMVTEEGIDNKDRLVDLFRNYFISSTDTLFVKQIKNHGSLLVELAWKMSDNLLETEILNLEKQEKGVFPQSMLEDMRIMRQKRNEWVTEQLEKHGGNIAGNGITPQRVFSTLSAGEKRRMLVVVAEAAACAKRRTAVILDEPLAHLDSKNQGYQIEALKRIQKGINPVALIIVSHENIEALQTSLNHCQVVEIEQAN